MCIKKAKDKMLSLVRNNLSLKVLLSLKLGLACSRFNPGDVIYLKYLIVMRKKNKYFFKHKEFFGKCIAYRNRLFKTSLILRKAVKLNEIEQIFILDSPFLLGLGVQSAHKFNLKKLLFLRDYSGKYSRVRLSAGLKKKKE